MNMHAPKFLDTGRWGGLAYISEWQETMAGTLNVTDPANGNVLAAVGLCGPADIARAAKLAKAAQKTWAKTLPASPARDKFVANGQTKGTTKPAPAKAKKNYDRPKIFDSWDKNKDGFLAKDEFIPHMGDQADAPARFIRFDQDKDGRLSKDEFVRAGN